MNYIILLVGLLFTTSNAFLLNGVNVYKRIYGNNVVKVYEPENIDKKDTQAIVFYTGANSLIPADIYSNFIKSLNSFNFSVNVVTNDNLATKELLYDLREEYKEILPLSHSSGYVNIIETVNNLKNINKAVFLDPVDNSKLLDLKSNIPFLSSNVKPLNYLDNVLILNAEKSYKWSLFPKLEVPFIPVFALNLNELKKNNPNLEVEKILASDYGHSDVLDSLWSDLMHSTLSKGNENRDQKNLEQYHMWLSEQIYNFMNKDVLKEDVFEEDVFEEDVVQEDVFEEDVKIVKVNLDEDEDENYYVLE